MKRRSFLQYSGVTLLLLNACKPEILNSSDVGEKVLSLEFLSTPAANQQTPTGLVVCLHGWGSNAQDLVSVTPQLNLGEYQFLFPNGPFPHPNVSGGRAWYALQNRDYQGLAESRQRLTQFLKDLESTTGVPLSRTFLSGFSQGGAMTLDVGLTLPLAGLVVFSGYLHAEPQSSAAGYPPVLIMHGRQDQVVPLGAAQRAQMALTALGVSVDYHEFDLGHWIIPEEMAMMRRFILAHGASDASS